MRPRRQGDARRGEVGRDRRDLCRRAQEAVDANVIGSPCYVLDGEVFWGQDRLALLDSALKSGRKAYRMDAAM